MTQENYNNIGYTQGYTTTPTTLPSYQFRSTSTFQPIVGERSYIATPSYSQTSYRPRRATIDEEPDGEELGIIAPIGDIPFILMALMAGIYVIWKKKRKKIHELFAQFRKKQ